MNKLVRPILIFFLVLGSCNQAKKQQYGVVVLQTDFGLRDGAVSAMKGVMTGVSEDLKIYDLTHEIPAYNIWEAAYRLQQTASYWPSGTVFVSVVDPGVGTTRKSVVMKSKSGHYFVTPDNGTLTLVSESLGIEEVHEIDEAVNRRKGSEGSYTFHGRDVYAYTGARLASGLINLDQVGKTLPDSVVKIDYQKAIISGDSIKGNIPVLDIQYGNIWTNIPDTLLKQSKLNYGDSVKVRIYYQDSLLYSQKVPYVTTFGEVQEGKALAYVNSLMNFSLAINMGNFSEQYHVKSGPEWKLTLWK